MDAKKIKKMVEESRKTTSSRDIERFRRILEELEQQEKCNTFYSVKYCKIS